MKINLLAFCPFPSVDKEKQKRDGFHIPQPSVCAKCDLNCWEHAKTKTKVPLEHFECPKSVSMVLAKFPQGEILLNGLLVTDRNEAATGPIRNRLKAQKVQFSEIERWHNSTNTLISQVEHLAAWKTELLLECLHDMLHVVHIITHNAKGMIRRLPGSSPDEQIENAPADQKALLKSIVLLRTHLSMPGIVANPDSASYGDKYEISIYNMVDRLVRIHDQYASSRQIQIGILGSSFKMAICYPSIEVLALVLIDNAIKYSLKEKEVRVTVEDRENPSGVFVSVESYGPVIPKDVRDTVFEKGGTAEFTQAVASSGAGVGLYIGSVIAKAHGFDIKYTCESEGFVGGGNVPVGDNKFWFIIPC